VLSAKLLTFERYAFRHLTLIENANSELVTAKMNFTIKVNTRLGDPIKDNLKFNDLVKISSVTLSNNESINLTVMIYDPDEMDNYITAEVLLPRGDSIKLGKVVRRLTDENNLPRGKAHHNPILDTREYTVKFDDGEQLEYAANVIAENIYAQVDADGRKYMLMEYIIDHRKDKNAVPKDDEYVAINVKRNRKKPTDGWQFNIQWKDGSTTWDPLKPLKEASPIDIA
jgi:hypothetical protein